MSFAVIVAACGSSTPPPTVDPTDQPRPSATVLAQQSAQASAPPSGSPVATDVPTPSPGSTAQPTSQPTEPPSELAEVPFVPVVNFWSTRDSISLDELRDGLVAGQVLVALDDAQALPVDVPAGAQVADAAAVIAAVKDGATGLLRASDVQPSVRALGIDGVSLFGNDRIDDIAQWPLTAQVETSEPWDQSASWTLVAVGDMMFDRLVITHLNEAGGNKQHLFDGGTSRVARLRCCSFFGYTFPDVERTGNRGLVRQVLTNADLTVGNMESGVRYDAVHHSDPRGFLFTSDASWMPVLAENGFDILSMANNHALDGGVRGLREGMQAMTDAGIVPAGVGVGAAAAEPVYKDVNGTTVALIACDYIRSRRPPTEGRLASLSCQNGPVTESIREARENADTVIVYPHWGIEYEQPAGYQYRLSEEWIDAGADVVIGHHSHFPGGIYEYKDHVSMLSLGNFIFDQNFRQTTLMGLVLEATFNGGGKPVQMLVRPLLNVDAQPNFAEPGDAEWAFDIMKWQSRQLDWGGEPHPFTGYPMR